MGKQTAASAPSDGKTEWFHFLRHHFFCLQLFTSSVRILFNFCTFKWRNFLKNKKNCCRQPSFPVFTSHGLPLLARSVHKRTTRSPQPAKRRTCFTAGCLNVFLFFQGTLCHEFNRRLYRPTPGFLMSTVFLDSQHWTLIFFFSFFFCCPRSPTVGRI